MQRSAGGAVLDAWTGVTRDDRVLGGQPLAVALVEPADAARETVLVVHGLRGTHQGLRHLSRELAASGRRVAAPNLPGMGLSPLVGPAPSLERLAELVVALARQEARPPVLLGHSFGATVCCAAAAREPRAFSRLVLVSPVATCSARHGDPVNRLVTAATDAWCRLVLALPSWAGVAWCDRPGRGWFSNRALARRGAAGRRRVLERSVEAHDLHTSPAAAARSQWDATHHDCGEFASRVDIPVTIVAGDADVISPLPQLQCLTEAFPDARLHLLPGAGHLAHHEDAETIARLVLDDLDRAPTPTAAPQEAP